MSGIRREKRDSTNGRTNADLREGHAIKTRDMQRMAKGDATWHVDEEKAEVGDVVMSNLSGSTYEVKHVDAEGISNGLSRIKNGDYTIIQRKKEPQADEQVDVVNSPQHYTQGGVEVIDIIRQATEGASGFEGYTLGNVIKYVMRYRHKNGAEDLRKAGVYLAWLTADVEAKEKADK